MKKINGFKQDDVNLVWNEMQEIHTALGKTKDTDQMPRIYYTEVAKMFNGYTVEFLKTVINKLILDYRGYQMPSSKAINSVITEIRLDNQHKYKEDLFKDEVKTSETDKQYFARLIDKFREEHPQEEDEAEAGLKKVQERHQNIRSRIAAGFEWCEVAGKWVKRCDAEKIKVWSFMEKSGTNFRDQI